MPNCFFGGISENPVYHKVFGSRAEFANSMFDSSGCTVLRVFQQRNASKCDAFVAGDDAKR